MVINPLSTTYYLDSLIMKQYLKQRRHLHGLDNKFNIISDLLDAVKAGND